MRSISLALIIGLGFCTNLFAQVTEEEEEDFDQYGEVEYTGKKAKTYANAKITGLSPQRFATIGFETQLGFDARFSDIGSFPVDGDLPPTNENVRFNSISGMRLYANIPVISTVKGIWQMGLNYAKYNFVAQEPMATVVRPLGDPLQSNGLQTAGLFSTFYKPLNATTFLLFQGQVDLSGDYSLSNIQPLKFARYSAAALWGKRPSDRKQWAIGMSRTYRVGAMNYIPVVMFNYTNKANKWGTEILFPARGHVRRTFNSKSLLLMGYELEGQSYRIESLSTPNNSFEIRRGELKPRLEYQRQLIGYFWASAQAGVRLNYSFDADFLPDGKEFFRGFFGDQPFAMRNTLSPTPYFNLSISFVSP